MFTDDYRLAKICFLIFAIVVLCLYSYVEGNRKYLTLETCFANPLEYDGKEILLEQNPTVSKVFKDRFELCSGRKTIMVIGTAEGLSVHDYVSLRAIFHKEGYLTLKEIQVKKLRRLKISMSLVAAAFVAGLFLRRYRFNPQGLYFVERKECRI